MECYCIVIPSQPHPNVQRYDRLSCSAIILLFSTIELPGQASMAESQPRIKIGRPYRPSIKLPNMSIDLFHLIRSNIFLLSLFNLVKKHLLSSFNQNFYSLIYVRLKYLMTTLFMAA